MLVKLVLLVSLLVLLNLSNLSKAFEEYEIGTSGDTDISRENDGDTSSCLMPCLDRRGDGDGLSLRNKPMGDAGSGGIGEVESRAGGGVMLVVDVIGAEAELVWEDIALLL